MTQKVFILLCFCFQIQQIKAQRAHVIYAEALGSSMIYSLNYDMRFGQQHNGLGFRIGFSRLSRNGSSNNIPLQINYLLGQKQHLLEVGLGVLRLQQQDGAGAKSQFTFPNATLMYRFQPLEKGISFRIGWTPIYIRSSQTNAYDFSKLFWAWGGLSVGYRF
ncbi:MAG: hypothetical protein ACKVTZ_04530 [Bacteroidia bacterium]